MEQKIKEQAAELSGICATCIQPNGGPDSACFECENRGFYLGYIEGATRREKEIIDKAYDWLMHNLVDGLDAYYVERDFRKVMEG